MRTTMLPGAWPMRWLSGLKSVGPGISPDGSGIEVIRRVRAAYPGARCALLASRKDRNISQLGAAAGAEVVFYKPLIQRSLLEFLTGANACACY